MSEKKKPAKTVAIEVIKPGGCNTVLQLQEAEIVKQIVADHEACERSSRVAAFGALRNGIRLAWVRDNGSYGDLGKFIKEKLGDVSRQSCYRYIRIADAFLDELKLKDKKTHKLTNGGKVEPLLTTSLQQLEGGDLKHLEAPVKKMVSWVADRGLTQIYRDLSEEEPTHNLKGGARKRSAKDERAEQLEDALNDRTNLVTFRELKRWQLFDEDEMAVLASELEGFLKEVGEFQKAARSAAPKKWKPVVAGVCDAGLNPPGSKSRATTKGKTA